MDVTQTWPSIEAVAMYIAFPGVAGTTVREAEDEVLEGEAAEEVCRGESR